MFWYHVILQKQLFNPEISGDVESLVVSVRNEGDFNILLSPVLSPLLSKYFQEKNSYNYSRELKETFFRLGRLFSDSFYNNKEQNLRLWLLGSMIGSAECSFSLGKMFSKFAVVESSLESFLFWFFHLFIF